MLSLLVKEIKEEGKLEGKLESKLEHVRLMKEKGYSFKDISEITGLSINEIEKL